MATTTNYGWETPDDTDLVKDGALAMRTLGNAIDARFGNASSYPNQIVNVVSGISRPLPFAIAAGAGYGGAGSTVVTFPSGRFTVIPIVTLTNLGSTQRVIQSILTGSFTYQNVGGSNDTYYWTAIQMTSATSAG